MLRRTAERGYNGHRGDPEDRHQSHLAGISQIYDWHTFEQSVRSVIAHLQARRLRFVQVAIMAGMCRPMPLGTRMRVVGCGGVCFRGVAAVGSGGFQKAGIGDP